MPTKKLTDLFAERVHPPARGRIEYFDAAFGSLAPRVTSSGHKVVLAILSHRWPSAALYAGEISGTEACFRPARGLAHSRTGRHRGRSVRGAKGPPLPPAARAGNVCRRGAGLS